MAKRRQIGEGHYYRDGDYHCFRIKHNGKQLVRKAKSSSELREKVHTLQRELRETGAAEGRRRVGIDRHLDKWIESQAPRWDDTTKRSYVRNVGYLKRELGSTPIEKLRPMQIDTAMNNISERHGGRTAGLCFANLRGHVPMTKTREEIEQLKKSWAADPIWDIEDSEGFEEHRDELAKFHLQKRVEWAEAAAVRANGKILAFANVLGQLLDLDGMIRTIVRAEIDRRDDEDEFAATMRRERGL
jgi:hypothetical protein